MLLRGCLRASLDGADLEVDLEPGLGATAPLRARTAGNITPGGGPPVMIAIRPEEVELLAADEAVGGRNLVPATIDNALFVGERYQVSVNLRTGQRVLLQLSRMHEYQGGQSVWLQLPERSATVWPA